MPLFSLFLLCVAGMIFLFFAMCGVPLFGLFVLFVLGACFAVLAGLVNLFFTPPPTRRP